jgi:hypothetical protein
MNVDTVKSKTFRNISMPRLFLHLEGLALLVGVLFLYGNQHFNWWTFALFLLAPDLSAVFYALNPRVGSIAYNLVHTTIFPLALGLFSGFNGNSLGLQIALIWLAHIGMDRAVGYGFKYPSQFKDTHFSHI